MTVEFRPDGTAVELDDTYYEVDCSRRVGRRLFTNGVRAVEVISPGKRRDKKLAEYQRQHFKPEPRTEVTVPAVVEVVEPPSEIVDVVPPPIIDDAAEAEEFVGAVNDQDLYPVQPDVWYEARIDKASHNNRVLIVKLENASAVCIPTFISKAPGEHRMCLPTYLPNALSAVRLEIIDGKYRCLEMQVDGDPTSLRETAKVISWDPMRSTGRAERPCGCRITIIGAFEEEVHGFINFDDWIQFDLEKSRNRRNQWVGVRARKIEAPIAQGSKGNG